MNAVTVETFNDPEKLRQALATVLTSWALYREFRYYDQTDTIVLPTLLYLDCDNALCGKTTVWETQTWSGMTHFKSFEDVIYNCRNCKTSKIAYHYHWYKLSDKTTVCFVKFGQWPALERQISPELKKHLGGEDYDLYQKALRCRSQNLGIGALAYMRRVVEDRTNELLDMLAAEATQSGGAIDLSEIENAKMSYKFSDKINLAKKIIPSTLKPGSHNPIDQLHDIASEGLHWKSETDCAAMFDKARGVFEFLFQEMERRKRAAHDFHRNLTEIATRNS